MFVSDLWFLYGTNVQLVTIESVIVLIQYENLSLEIVILVKIDLSTIPNRYFLSSK